MHLCAHTCVVQVRLGIYDFSFLHVLSLPDGIETHSVAFYLVTDLQNALHPDLKISREEIIFVTSALFSKVRRKLIRGSDC